MAQHAPLRSAPVTESAKQQFLDVYEKEHATTMRVLRAYPHDQLELRPSPQCRTARELGWVFVAERGLGIAVFNHELDQLMQGEMPQPPESWDELLAALDQAHLGFGDLIRGTPAERLGDAVQFFTGPQTMGDYTRLEWLWFLVHDQIHHRGQFSVYLRMAGGRLPSIYGPTADEPWM